MTTYTSTLPDQLWQQLQTVADELNCPKNKIIEKALTIYLDQLNRAAYVKSFSKAVEDHDIMNIAEEGMADYMKQLDETR